MSSPTIVYNGYSIPNMYGKFFYSESYTEFTFSCMFMIKSSSASGLVSQCSTAEEKLSEWNRDFSLVFKGSSEYDKSHGDNTGFLNRPSLQKITNETCTETSRPYKFTVTGKNPAGQEGYNYRQSGEIRTMQNYKDRLRVVVKGRYTAGGVNSATENYNLYGPDWADTVANSFGVMELTDENTKIEQEDKLLDFIRTYQEKLGISITYNGYSIPGNYNTFDFANDYINTVVSCDFQIERDGANAAETALRIPNKTLTVNITNGESYSFSHTANTGFLAEPSLRKLSNKAGDDEFCHYRFSVKVNMQADDPGQGFRQSANINYFYEPTDQRRITFSGIYTASASPAQSASFNYHSGATGGKAWAEGILASISGEYKKVSEFYNIDKEDKLANFNIEYLEQMSSDSKSFYVEPAIFNPTCRFTIAPVQIIGDTTTNSGFTGVPKLQISIKYSAEMSKDITVDDEGMHVEYVNKVRPWLIEHSYDVLGLSNFPAASRTYIIDEEDYTIDPYDFTLSGRMSLTVLKSTTSLIEVNEIIINNMDEGAILAKIWDNKDHSFFKTNIGRRLDVNRSITLLQYGRKPSFPKPLKDHKRLRIVENLTVMDQGVGSPLASYAKSLPLYRTNYLENFIYVGKSGVNDIEKSGV